MAWNDRAKNYLGRPQPQPQQQSTGVNADSQAVLHCPKVATVRLKWWPTEITRSALGRTWIETERPGRRPLLLSTGLMLDEYVVSYLFRHKDLSEPVADHVDAITRIARSKTPAELVLAGAARGLFHVTDLSLVEVEHTTGGHPASVDVSLTLKRASDATVNVGPIPRKRNKNPKKKKKK